MASANYDDDKTIGEQVFQFIQDNQLDNLIEDMTKYLMLWKPQEPVTALIDYLGKRQNGAGENENQETPASTEQKALEYLQEHKIQKLLEELCATAAYHRPENVVQFLIDELKRVKDAPENRDPKFFTETDLKGMFSLFDPTQKGHISKQQVETGLANLGLENTTVEKDGSHDTGRYTEEDFVQIGMERLKQEKIL